jgi:hypothetical protein
LSHGRAPRRFVDYKLDRQSSVALDPSNLAQQCTAMKTVLLLQDSYLMIYIYIILYILYIFIYI